MYYISSPPDYYLKYQVDPPSYLGVSNPACPPCTDLYQDRIETIEPDRDERNKKECYKNPTLRCSWRRSACNGGFAHVRQATGHFPLHTYCIWTPRAAAPDRARQGKARLQGKMTGIL